jgi:formimidoylglutamate deiminase
VLAGGAAAARHGAWGLVPGARADLLVADSAEPALAGVPPGRTLDALVFSSPGRPWLDVMVAGRWRCRDGRHVAGPRIAEQFAQAMSAVWQGPERA